MLNVGDVLQDRYRVMAQLGQGGMGAVYQAWDTRLNISVALKEMISQSDMDAQVLAEFQAQFQQEATVLARLNHPNLVGVTDFFEESLNVYLVMQYVQGDSLSERIKGEGALPEAQVVAWAAQLLDALSYCHSQGVIHRDIKPQNIIINSDGDAVLVDFGLVKLWDPNDPKTRTAVRGVGTPQYAPPEQYEMDAGHTEPRSDIYSVGATLYHALTGETPLTATMRIAAPEDFRPIREVIADVSEATVTTIERAMELPRSQRWSTAVEMATALGMSIRDWGGGVVIGPDGATAVLGTAVLGGAPATRPVSQRRRWSLWAWGLIAGLGLVVLGGASWLALANFGPAKSVPTVTLTPSPTLVPDTHTPTPTETLTPSPTATKTRHATATLLPTSTARPTKTQTSEPSPTLEVPTATPPPLPTAVPQSVTATPLPVAPPIAVPTAVPVQGDGTGSIIFTVRVGGEYALYSADPYGTQMAEIGKTDYGHSTCGGATVSTLMGQVISVYPINKCNITERTDVCTSPDQQYKVMTNLVGSDWTVNLQGVADGSDQWYYQGQINRDIGVQWALNSRYALFGVQNTVNIITVGSPSYQQVISYMDPNWPPQFAPNGSLLYYLRPVGAEGASDVFVVNVDGTGERNVTNAPIAHKLCPRWRYP